MSALANHAFAKMNGIGNEIVVVDLRDSSASVSSQEARAVASPAGVPFDQLMVLQPPRIKGTEAFIRIYNNDGSEVAACGNGRGNSNVFKYATRSATSCSLGSYWCNVRKVPLTRSASVGLVPCQP